MAVERGWTFCPADEDFARFPGLNRVNPIMVQGAALADFTMISGFDLDITKAIRNGAEVEVDPTATQPFIRVL